MKKVYSLLVMAIFLYLHVQGQVAGDFRSKAAGPGNWNDFNAWELYDGTSWVAAIAGQLPLATSNAEIQAGHVMVINATGMTSGHLTVNGSLTFDAVTVSALTVSGNVVVNATGSFTSPGSGTVLTHALGISGDLTVDGTFNMNVFSTAAVVVTFTGATNNVVNGTGATINFYSIVVNKGTSNVNILDVTSVITLSTPAAAGTRLTITNGTFKLSSGSVLTPYYGDNIICQYQGKLWLNHSAAVVQRVGSGTSAVAGRPLVYGTLQIDAGTFSYGSGSDQFITQGTIIMGGPNATMNIYGALSLSTGSQFIMTGGNINIDGRAANSYSGAYLFWLDNHPCCTNTFTFTGGNITIVDPPATTTTIAISMQPSYGTGYITFNANGGTFRLGDGTSDVAGNVNGFQINSGGYYFSNLVVNNNPASVQTTRIAKLYANSTINGTLTINSGTANQFLLNGKVLTTAGNIVNSGTFNGDGNALDGITFNGSTQQVISGAGTFTNGNIRNITLNSTAVATPSVDLQVPLSVSNAITLTKGTLGSTNASALTFGRSASSATFALTRSGGSLLADPTFSFGGVSTINYIYSAPVPAAAITTGMEISSSITPTTLTINNVSGVTLDKAIGCTTLALTSGILNTTATNSLTVLGTTAGNVTGGSATSYVNGPLTRAIPNNAAAANYKFPVGNLVYELFEFGSLTTGGTGTATFTAEAFDNGPYTGTPGTGLSSVNTNKYWALSGNLGSVTITSSNVRLTDAGMMETNKVGQSNSATGTYNSLGGLVSGSTVTSASPVDYSALSTGTFFRIGLPTPFGAGTYAIGPQASYAGYDGTFASLTAAAASVSAVPLTGHVLFEFQSDYLPSVEIYPVNFPATIYGSLTTTITFRPAADVASLINLTNASTIITINGVDYLTFDGRPGGTGSNRYLQFTNTSVSGAAASMTNTSTNNVFQYCNFKGSTTTASTGVFTISAAGNSNYTFDHCTFDGSGSALHCLYTVGANDNGTITNNNLFDFRNGGGIYLAAGSNNGIIDNNNIYQTTPYAAFAGTSYGIYLGSGTNVQISNNNIGGSGPGPTGTWTVSTAAASYNFTGINAVFGTTGTASRIYNNKIQNFDWKTNATSSTWTGINASNLVNIGTDGANYIGNATSTGNIIITYYNAAAAQATGIIAAGTAVIENNVIGSITTLLAAGVTGTGSSFTGINSSSSGIINNNTIGSLTTPLSINIAAQSTGTTTQNLTGITSTGTGLTLTNNIIANINNGSTVASGFTKGILRGNYSGAVAISSNKVFSVSSSQTTSNLNIVGIELQASNAPSITVTGNEIYNLVNTAASSAAVTINGILYNAATTSVNVISKNLIHSFITSSNTAVQNGIVLTYGSCTLQNNVIRLGIDKDGNSITSTAQINGILKSATTTGATYNFYFNSIYIGGSGVTVSAIKTFALSITNHTVENLKDNILVNRRTTGAAGSLSYAIGIPTGITTGYSSDYNIFYALPPDGILARVGTTDVTTMSAFQGIMAGQELHSGFGNPLLTSPATNMATMSLVPQNFSPAEGQGIDIASVTDDYSGNLRNSLTPVDIGAYAGDFTPPTADEDIFYPVIAYTPLLNTGQTTNRTVLSFATITDQFTGVDVTAGTKPRLYFKKSTDASAFVGNTSADNGWKWVEASNSSSPFDFTIDYSIINGGSVAIGDVIQYYLVAQDLATIPNVSFKPGLGASGTSVDPAGMTAPTTPNSYGIVPTIASAVDVGTGYAYTTLTGSLASGGLFAAINAGVIASNVVATVRTNTAEPGTVSLNLITEEGAGAGTYTLTIQSDGISHTLAGATSSLSTPLFLFNGACRVIIDGGPSKSLTFRNANTTYNITGPVMQFQNNSQNCTVTRCIFESNSYGPTAGEIVAGTVGFNSLTIFKNNFRNYSAGTPPNNQRCCIYSNSVNNSLTIDSNNFCNYRSSYASDSPSYGIYLPAVANGCTISGNSFYMETGQNPISYQVSIHIGGGNSHIISGNYIGGSGPLCSGTWTATLGTSFGQTGSGIYLTNTTLPASTVQGNIIQNLTLAGTGGWSGIHVNSGIANVIGNTVGSATTANAIQFTGSSSTVYGITNSTPTGINTFEGNTIANVTSSVASGAAYFRAMMMAGGIVRKNYIFNIGALNAAATPTYYGIYNSSVSATNEFSNNLICLNGGNSTNPVLYGFYDAATTGTFGLYFNSVNIYGNTTGTAATYAFYRNSNAIYDVKNNILSNQRTGTGNHYAIFSTTAAALTSDYNDLFTTGAAFGSFGGSAKPDFASWQAIPQDLNSVNVNPTFTSNTDLHTTAIELNNGGQTVAGITTDFSNVTRSNPPDIGAYEFMPIIFINTLAATSIDKTTATLNGDINSSNEIVTMSFEYGTTVSYGNNVAGVPASVQSITSTPVSAAISLLVPNTLYHYRIKGQLTTWSEIVYGSDLTFTTLPDPTITGPTPACASTGGYIYTTESGMTGYTWAISPGGSITDGQGTNAITVTWNSEGAQWVSVNYNNSAGFPALAPTVYNVSVNAAPVITITGSDIVCEGTTGVVYTTEPLMTNYLWNVTGGTVTSGGTLTDNSVSVTWDVAGAQSVSVLYTDPNGCTASSATVFPVTVYTTPSPTIGGLTSVCTGTTGVNYTTEPGMSGYSWSVSAGGSVTAGGTSADDFVTVTWNDAGAQSVSVNYTTPDGCSAFSPTIFPVNVDAILPVDVSITADANSVCDGTTVNFTAIGVNGGTTPTYQWYNGATPVGTNSELFSYVPANGDVITVVLTSSLACQSGGPATSNAIDMIVIPIMPVSVSIVESANSVCEGTTVDFTAIPTNEGLNPVYDWYINDVLSTSTIVPAFSYVPQPNDQVKVVLTSSLPCTSGNPATSNVIAMTVNLFPVAAGAITGPAELCIGSTGIAYSVGAIANATSYSWTVPAGMTITAGATTNYITVDVDLTIFTGDITVQGVNDCGTGALSPALTVHSVMLPGAHGNISGPNSVCKGATGVVYSIAPVLYASGYIWSVPPNANIVGGINTTSITVNFATNSSSGQVSVYATNVCGNGPTQPSLNVNVNPIPGTPTITYNPSKNRLTSNQPSNNQWYLNGVAIPGATGKNYNPTVSGDYYDIITRNGCSSLPSNTITVILAKNFIANEDQEDNTGTSLLIYPNPNQGQFNYEITLTEEEVLSIVIYNSLGAKVYEEHSLQGKETFEGRIDLTSWNFGIYTMHVYGNKTSIFEKIVIGK